MITLGIIAVFVVSYAEERNRGAVRAEVAN